MVVCIPENANDMFGADTKKKGIEMIPFLSICLAREERLELPTAGFGDRYSTN